jgi:hypothetical protein
LTAKIELVPLRCIRCDTPVPAEGEEIAWVCKQCGQGLLLDEREGLQNLEIHYSAGISPGVKGKPYWVAKGRVNMVREAHREWTGTQQGAADRFWGPARQFIIPAFNTSLDELLEFASFLFYNPPDLVAGPAAPFEPVSLFPHDVAPLVEYIILAVEAGREDDIKSIGVTVELDAPILWVLP